MSRNPIDPYRDDIESATDKVEEKADTVADRIKEQTEAARDTVVDVSRRAGETVKEGGARAAEKFDQGRVSAAGTLERAADKLHERATDAPGGERGTRAVHKVAGGLESTASYLREHGAREMKNDVAEMIQKNPGRTLLAAVAVGFLAGRLIRR